MNFGFVLISLRLNLGDDSWAARLLMAEEWGCPICICLGWPNGLIISWITNEGFDTYTCYNDT